MKAMNEKATAAQALAAMADESAADHRKLAYHAASVLRGADWSIRTTRIPADPSNPLPDPQDMTVGAAGFLTVLRRGTVVERVSAETWEASLVMAFARVCLYYPSLHK